MTIRFLCPNGHGLSSADNKAGSYGKCPNCDVLFQVPFADGNGDELRTAEAVIGFACPDGHAIRVPARMSGQLGKCPACDKTIRVPGAPAPGSAKSMKLAASGSSGEAVEEGIMLDPEGDEALDEESSGSGQSSESGTVGHYPHPHAAPEGGEGESPFAGQTLPGGVFPAIANPADSPHAMTALFEALWDGTQRDAIVDVYFGDNERISPQHYAHELSHGQHAVFAVLEQNDTHTLYLIPWSRIHRVAVREITELPPGMFD